MRSRKKTNTIDKDHLDWKLKSEKLEDGIEERVPYRPLSFCFIARLHEEQLFFQHLQTFLTPYSGRILSLFGYTMHCIALPACLPTLAIIF